MNFLNPQQNLHRSQQLQSRWALQSLPLIAINTQRDIARRRAAIDFFLKTEMDQTMIDLYSNFKRIAPSIMSHPSLPEFSKSDDYQKVRAFLNVCELIAVGINQDAFSERVSLAYWGEVLPKAYRDTEPLIKHVRETSEDGSPETYSDLEAICKKWTSKVEIGGRARIFQRLVICSAVLSAILGVNASPSEWQTWFGKPFTWLKGLLSLV